MLGGARVVGRVGDWDVGLINLQSRKANSISAENFGVFRLRRNVINQRSYVGGMVTSRINGDGEENYAYGLDGIINVFGEDYLQVNLAQSQDSEDPTKPGCDRQIQNIPTLGKPSIKRIWVFSQLFKRWK